MRIKSHIWIAAYRRRLETSFIPVMVTRKGNAEAGAIFIKINLLDGRARILRPAMTGLGGGSMDRFWSYALGSGGEAVEETAADAYLARQAEFDSDMWVIELEDREGRHGLEDAIADE